jgi:hypothetical protein
VLGSSDNHSPLPIWSSADESAVQNGSLWSLQGFSPIFQKILYRGENSTGIVPKTPWEIVQFSALASVMTEVLLYTCPNCEASCSVALDLAGFNVVCPSCAQEFTATPPDSSANFQLPDAIPFFKSGKLEILKNHLNKLTSNGELSKSDEIAPTRATLMII